LNESQKSSTTTRRGFCAAAAWRTYQVTVRVTGVARLKPHIIFNRPFRLHETLPHLLLGMVPNEPFPGLVFAQHIIFIVERRDLSGRFKILESPAIHAAVSFKYLEPCAMLPGPTM
jgi:hypothetical protein